MIQTTFKHPIHKSVSFFLSHRLPARGSTLSWTWNRPWPYRPVAFWRTPTGSLDKWNRSHACIHWELPSITKEVSVFISSWPNPIVYDLGHINSLSTSWITSSYMIVSCLQVLSFNLKQHMLCIEIPHQILENLKLMGLQSAWWEQKTTSTAAPQAAGFLASELRKPITISHHEPLLASLPSSGTGAHMDHGFGTKSASNCWHMQLSIT